ncbi:MarR family winged helix-turn-helix transcriptional regulator [Desulfocurvus sp. DL9XJH121]
MKEPNNSPKFEALLALAKRMEQSKAQASAACLDVLQTATALRRTLHERFFREAMSEGRFTVLALLLNAPDWCLAPSELAMASGVTRATMTGLLDGLEADGLVERRAHRSDRRKLSVRLTGTGRTTLLELAPGLYKILSQVGAALAQERVKPLGDALSKLRGGAE